jgi:hypothetical protein
MSERKTNSHFSVCREEHRFPLAAKPTRQLSHQPVAIGATTELQGSSETKKRQRDARESPHEGIRRLELNRVAVAFCLARIGAFVGLELLAAGEFAVTAPKALAHWPLAQDARDVIGTVHGKPKNIEFGRGGDGSEKLAALFSGRDSMIEIPAKVVSTATSW